MIAELKRLSGCPDTTDEEEDEAAMLMEEANMPIGELLERFKVFPDFVVYHNSRA